MTGAIQNQVAKRSPEKKTMQDYVRSMEGEIKKALPSVITPERFTRILFSALSVNPQLGACTPQSFLGAMMTSAQLGLEVNTPLGHAFIIPYRNKGQLEAQFQIGYKGMIDLAYRSESISVAQANVVYENDKFECVYGLNPKLDHTPSLGDRGKAIGVYAYFTTKSGGFGFEVQSMDFIRKHAETYSKSYSSNSSPWKTNFEEMARKTMLKRVLKYAPLSTEAANMIAQDGVVKKVISEDMYSVPNELAQEVMPGVIEAEFDEIPVDENGEIIEGV